MADRLRLHAPAKINLGLRILRRREDGYHELETILHTLAWGDEVHLERGEGIALDVEAAPDAPRREDVDRIPSGEENLAWRAARTLQDRAGVPGVRIRLIKRVPPGAGLGGGSSDAAAVLRGVDRLYGCDLSREELGAMAAELGADVPFFLDGGCALAEGVGDRLTPLRAEPGTPVLLLFPDFGIDTTLAYQALNWTLTRPGTYREYLPSNSRPVRVCVEQGLVNDLQEAVIEANPGIRSLLEQLRVEGAVYASMTGSGSCVYGLFDTKEGTREASQRLADPDLDTVRTELR